MLDGCEVDELGNLERKNLEGIVGEDVAKRENCGDVLRAADFEK